jgi:hypothetical protein
MAHRPFFRLSFSITEGIVSQAASIQQANTSEVLRKLFRRKAIEVGGIPELARIVGVNAHRYYNQMNRGNGILADLIVAHCTQTGDDEILCAMADACDRDITPKVKFLRTAHPRQTIQSIELDVHHATTALTEIVEATLRDKRFSSREQSAIKAAAQKAKVKIAELEARVTGGMR